MRGGDAHEYGANKQHGSSGAQGNRGGRDDEQHTNGDWSDEVEGLLADRIESEGALLESRPSSEHASRRAHGGPKWRRGVACCSAKDDRDSR